MQKETLLAYSDLQREIKDIEENIERIKTRSRMAAGIVTGRNKTTEDRMAADMAKEEQLIELYRKRLTQSAELQIEIEQAINSLPERERVIMRYRYVDGLSWNKIKRKVNYSDHVYRIHARALKILKNM